MKRKLLTVFAALLVMLAVVPAHPLADESGLVPGMYEVPLQVLKPDVDEASAAGGHVADKAYLFVDEDGETYAILTLLNAAWWQSIQVQETQPGTFDEDNFAEAEVLSEDEEANTREVMFRVPNINDHLNARIHISVTGIPGMGSYDKSYDIRLKFNVDEAVPYDLNDEDENWYEDGEYTVEFQVLHATEDKASSMAGYVATPARLTVADGQLYATITLTNHEQISGFQVAYDGEYVDADVVHVDVEANTRDIRFQVPTLSAVLNAKVQIYVAARDYTGSYDVRIAFDPATVTPVETAAQVVTFADIQDSWAKSYIEELATQGILNGVSADRFAPNAVVTRAQFAVMLARALDLPLEAYEGLFSDVPETLTWAAQEIEAANRVGIVLGSEGKFNPNDQITREQMVTMVVRAVKHVKPELTAQLTAPVQFADAAEIASYAKDAVDAAAALDIINGIEKGNQTFFAPKDHANRAQAAKVIHAMLEALQ